MCLARYFMKTKNPPPESRQAEEPVYLISAPALWSGHVESYLEELAIPYLKQGRRGAALTVELGTAGEIYDYYIPASASERASEGLDQIRELIGS